MTDTNNPDALGALGASAGEMLGGNRTEDTEITKSQQERSVRSALHSTSAFFSPRSLEAYRHVPYDIDVEQALLGAILRDNRAMERASALIKPDHFYDPLHGRIFATMSQMIEGGGVVVTPLTLHATMKSDPGVIETGGQTYFDAMRSATPAIPNVKDYADILAELAVRRSLIRIGEDIVNSAYDAPSEKSALHMVEDAGKALLNATEQAWSLGGGSLPVINAANFQGVEVPPRAEFVEGLIPAHVVSILGGDGATGKSLLAAQLAVSACTGANWVGRVVFDQGPVIFLSAEDDAEELHRRLAAILESQDGTFDQLSGLHLVPLVGQDALLATKTRDDTIQSTNLFAALEARIRDLRPVLVVIDNRSDVFGGDENSRVQARQFISALRSWCTKYETNVLLLAHPSVSGMLSGSGTSGSTAWNNSVRSRLYLERIIKNQVEDDPDARVLRSKKANYGPGGQQIHLRWDRGVFKVQTAGQSDTARAAEAKADKVFMELLTTYTSEGRPVGATPGHSYAPSTFATDKRAGGITKHAFGAAMNRLFSSAKIRIEESGPPSKRRKHLVVA